MRLSEGLSRPALVGAGKNDEDLQLSPIEPAWILEGRPEARARRLQTSADGAATTVVWSCTAGRFDWFYDFDETIVILEGSVVIESDGAPPKRYGVGDVIFFRDGATARWHVEDYVKKVAFCRQTNPFGLGLAVRVVNRLRSLFSGSRRGAAALAGASVEARPEPARSL